MMNVCMYNMHMHVHECRQVQHMHVCEIVAYACMHVANIYVFGDMLRRHARIAVPSSCAV
jgi:hypothetical protein